MEKQRISIGVNVKNFFELGYSDYLSARFLLNNDFMEQGAAMASTAIEKYIKGVFAIEGKKAKFHLDNYKKLKGISSQTKINIFSKLDESFLLILSRAYKLRYWDNINSEIGYGFLEHQFLGELDFTVNMIENKFMVIAESSNQKSKSRYHLEWKRKNPHLVENNYIAMGHNKVDWMNKEGKLFNFFLTKGKKAYHLVGSQGSISLKDGYKGSILSLDKIKLNND